MYDFTPLLLCFILLFLQSSRYFCKTSSFSATLIVPLKEAFLIQELKKFIQNLETWKVKFIVQLDIKTHIFNEVCFFFPYVFLEVSFSLHLCLPQEKSPIFMLCTMRLVSLLPFSLSISSSDLKFDYFN